MFDFSFLMRTAMLEKHNFRHAEPFPHIVINEVVHENLIKDLRDDAKYEPKHYTYQNGLERKHATDAVDDMDPNLREYFRCVSSIHFLAFLEMLTGFEGLLNDPSYRGGGIHHIEPGGTLKAHVDFNIHPYYGFKRRLNVITFLTDHENDSGGWLELWDRGGENCIKSVCPKPGRMVIFETSSDGYHGHPKPNDFDRLSLATYYYTVHGAGERPHSTTFSLGDENNPEAKELIDKRSKGRL